MATAIHLPGAPETFSLLSKTIKHKRKRCRRSKFFFLDKPNKSLASQVHFRLRLRDQDILPPMLARIPDEVIEQAKSTLNFLNKRQRKIFEKKLLIFEGLCRRLIAITQTKARNTRHAIRLMRILLESSKAALVAADDVALESYRSTQKTLFQKCPSKKLRESFRKFNPTNFAYIFQNSARQYQQWALEVVHKISVACRIIKSKHNNKRLLKLAGRYVTASAEAAYFNTQGYSSYPWYPFNGWGYPYPIYRAEAAKGQAGPEIQASVKRAPVVDERVSVELQADGVQVRESALAGEATPESLEAAENPEVKKSALVVDVDEGQLPQSRSIAPAVDVEGGQAQRLSIPYYPYYRTNIQTLERSLFLTKEIKWKLTCSKEAWLKVLNKAKDNYLSCVENIPGRLPQTSIRELSKFFKEFRKVRFPKTHIRKSFKRVTSRVSDIDTYSFWYSDYPIFDVTVLEKNRKDLLQCSKITIKKSLAKVSKSKSVKPAPVKVKAVKKVVKKTPKVIKCFSAPPISDLEHTILRTLNNVNDFGDALRKIHLLSEKKIFSPMKDEFAIYFSDSYTTASTLAESSFRVYYELINKARRTAKSSVNELFYTEVRKCGFTSVDTLESLTNFNYNIISPAYSLRKWAYEWLNNQKELNETQQHLLRGIIRWSIWFEIYTRVINYRLGFYRSIRYSTDPKWIVQSAQRSLKYLKDSFRWLENQIAPYDVLGFNRPNVRYAQDPLQFQIRKIWGEERQLIDTIKARLDRFEDWEGLENPSILFRSVQKKFSTIPKLFKRAIKSGK